LRYLNLTSYKRLSFLSSNALLINYLLPRSSAFLLLLLICCL
jgi:hypothetical protein